jgi:hypothetical protein
VQNPFYEMEMPIRCDLFNKHLERVMQKSSSQKRRGS